MGTKYDIRTSDRILRDKILKRSKDFLNDLIMPQADCVMVQYLEDKVVSISILNSLDETLLFKTISQNDL